MDFYPVPSLRFQSALKIATCITCHPSVVKSSASSHYEQIRTLFLKADRQFQFQDEVTSWAEILSDFSLPVELEHDVSRLMHLVLKQLYDFIMEAKKVFYEPNFPLKNIEELVHCLCWTSDGFIDKNRTVDSMKMFVSGLFTNEEETVKKNFITLCSYFLDGHMFRVWRGEYGNIISKDIQAYVDYSEDFRQKLTSDVSIENCSNWSVIDSLRDFELMKVCWEKSSQSVRNRIIDALLNNLRSHGGYDGYVNHTRILRFCLMQCGKKKRKTIIKDCISNGSNCIKLLFKFRALPDRSVYINLVKHVVEKSKKIALTSYVETIRASPLSFVCFNEITMSHLFIELWKNSRTEHKTEFFKWDDGIRGILHCDSFDMKIMVTLFLEYFSCVENQHYLIKYGHHLYETVVDFDDADIETFVQVFPVFAVKLKEIAKQYLMLEAHYPWLCCKGMQVVKKCIQLSGITSVDERKIKKQFYLHLFGDGLPNFYNPYDVMDFIDWCIVDEKTRRVLKMRTKREMTPRDKNEYWETKKRNVGDIYYENIWYEYTKMLKGNN